jgi:hypothetical protein
MSIPTADRMMGLMARMGYEPLLKTIVGAIQVAMENINVAKPLTSSQVIELADIILDSATEDNLALEDFILFLQKLVRGESGKLFNQIDPPSFMRMFEAYRQERHDECMKIREEQNAHVKSLPAPERTTTKRGQDENYFSDAWKQLGRDDLNRQINEAKNYEPSKKSSDAKNGS